MRILLCFGLVVSFYASAASMCGGSTCDGESLRTPLKPGTTAMCDGSACGDDNVAQRRLDCMARNHRKQMEYITCLALCINKDDNYCRLCTRIKSYLFPCD